MLVNCLCLGKREPLDLAVIFGSTASNADEVLAAQKMIVQAIVTKNFVSSKDGLQIGAILDGSSPQILFKLSDSSSRTSLYDEIRKIDKQASATNLGAALGDIQNQLFSTVNGARNGAEKTVLLFLDGESLKADSLKDDIRNLEQAGIKVVIVVMGGKLNVEMEIKLFGLVDDRTQIFYPETPDDATKLVDPINKELRKGKLDGLERVTYTFIVGIIVVGKNDTQH